MTVPGRILMIWSEVIVRCNNCRTFPARLHASMSFLCGLAPVWTRSDELIIMSSYSRFVSVWDLLTSNRMISLPEPTHSDVSSTWENGMKKCLRKTKWKPLLRDFELIRAAGANLGTLWKNTSKLKSQPNRNRNWRPWLICYLHVQRYRSINDRQSLVSLFV